MNIRTIFSDSQRKTKCRRCGQNVIKATQRHGGDLLFMDPIVSFGVQPDLFEGRAVEDIDCVMSPPHDDICEVLKKNRQKKGVTRVRTVPRSNP